MGKVIGIDLGTTNSCVAVLENDQPVVITNAEGSRTTPSVVAFTKNGERLVGDTAKRQAAVNVDRTFFSIKREMGTNYRAKIDGKQYTPQEISSMILRKLKKDAEAYLGEKVTEAVISVPAYFNEVKRKAVKQAGELAGLKVERMISEPTAAAIAYGLYEKKEDTRFLVFDLGGGTFDVSILELYENILEVRAVAGDNYLGGEDFTKVMEKMFLNKTGINANSLTAKEQVRLYRQAEEAKRRINDADKVEITCLIKDEPETVEITTKEYEEECEDLFSKIREPVKRSLSDAGLSLKDIDEVVLIGGATKLQIFRDFFIRVFHKFPDTSINPDEAVALGAAIQGAMKERKEAVKEMILTDVCSFTLGTEVVMEYSDGLMEDGHYCPIIDRNTVIPTSKTKRLYTVHDDQDRVTVRVLQGESRLARNNLYLGELEIKVPKAPKGEEAIDVTYTYDINSLLEVEAKVVSTGETSKLVIKGKDNTMTEEEIAKRMEELSYLKVQLRDQEENKLVLLRAERMYEESLGKQRERLEAGIRLFEDALRSEDRKKVEESKKTLYELMEDD